ncbi:MAG: hypothetical protein K2X09_00680 [Rickettsiales bacterium]|nr:hypothetical protein [Rickettsiales bacterium]
MNSAAQAMTMQPSMPLSMEAYRHAEFRAMVVRRMNAARTAGQSPEAVAARIAAEQRALAAAITEPALITVAANALMNAQAAIHPNPRYQSTPEQAHESMRQIMHRRAAEAKQFSDMLSQPRHVAELAAMTPKEADAAVPALRAVKLNDVLGDLLHLENGAPQVIAHIDASAKGAMLEHDALAMVFAPDGVLHAALMKGLAAKLPAHDTHGIHAIVSEWLCAREAAAKITSELSSNEGAAYREAVRQSSEWHRRVADKAVAALVAVPTTTVHKAGLERTPPRRDHEKEKTANQRAEDVAYTINHALSCGTTDVVLQPALAAAFGINVGCGEHGHAHGKQQLTLKTFAHEAGHYLKGEIIGDFAAVPLTIGVQRFFPSFMHGLRTLFEPLLGWAFRGGANRTARHWGKEHGLAPDDAQVKAHADEMYEHEVSHLPQAVVWNMFAYPIGAVAQKIGGHGRSYPEIFKSKLVGAAVSNGLLIGGRMVAPGAAQKWDAMTGDNIFLPVSKTVGKLFGVDEDAIERAAKKDKDRKAPVWSTRVEDESHGKETEAMGLRQ